MSKLIAPYKELFLMIEEDNQDKLICDSVHGLIIYKERFVLKVTFGEGPTHLNLRNSLLMINEDDPLDIDLVQVEIKRYIDFIEGLAKQSQSSTIGHNFTKDEVDALTIYAKRQNKTVEELVLETIDASFKELIEKVTSENNDFVN